jgi:hypothetical protein
MLSITELSGTSSKWRYVLFIVIITFFMHFLNACCSSKWLGWLSKSLWLLKCAFLKLITLAWYRLRCSAPVRVTGLVQRLLWELLLSFEQAISSHVALLTAIETFAESAVLFLIFFSICFVHLSENWYVYIHWNCLIIWMMSMLRSSIAIVLLVLPSVMVSTRM